MNDAKSTTSIKESLSGQVARAAMWLLASRVWSQLMSLTIGVVLARLLQPADFGLLGMVTVFTGFFGMLSDMGLATAVIQRQDLKPAEISSIFWFNIGASLVIALILVGLGPLVATVYSQPAVVPVLTALALTFPISSLATMHCALLQKALRFGLLTKINIFSSLVAGVAALFAAFGGWEIWALVLQSFVLSSVATLAYWMYSPWRPSLHFAWKDLERVWGFGLNLTGFQIVNYWARTADNFLVGRFLGASALGAYSLAYTLMTYPISNLSSIAQSVLLPAFAKVQDETLRIADAYIKSCRYLSFFILPAMIGLALVAREAVVVIYGPKWDEAGRVLQILAWVGTFQPFVSLAGSLVIARGFARWFFWWGVIASTVTVASFVIGLRWGTVGVAASYLAAQVMLTLIGMPIQYRKVDVSVGKLLHSMAIPVTASVCMAVVVISTRFCLGAYHVHAPGIVLATCIAAGILSYSFILIMLRRHYWLELRTDLSRAFQLGQRVS